MNSAPSTHTTDARTRAFFSAFGVGGVAVAAAELGLLALDGFLVAGALEPGLIASVVLFCTGLVCLMGSLGLASLIALPERVRRYVLDAAAVAPICSVAFLFLFQNSYRLGWQSVSFAGLVWSGVLFDLGLAVVIAAIAALVYRRLALSRATQLVNAAIAVGLILFVVFASTHRNGFLNQVIYLSHLLGLGVYVGLASLWTFHDRSRLERGGIAWAKVGLVALIGAGALAGGMTLAHGSTDRAKTFLYDRMRLMPTLLRPTAPSAADAPPRVDCADGVEADEQPREARGRAKSSPAVAPTEHVVLIIIDTLRADTASDPEVMPRLNQWSRGATRFRHAYSAAPSTGYAMQALSCGSARGDTDTCEPLVERLESEDIATFGVISHSHLDHTLFPGVELTAGDEDGGNVVHQPHSNASRHSEEVNRRASQWLDEMEQHDKTFTLVHYFDPHAYYVGDEPGWQLDSARERYDSEARHTDKWLGRYLSALEDSEVAGDATIIVTGDHGEEFGEHRYGYHGTYLYDESIRVPLYVKHPSMPAGRTVNAPASLIDIYPTVLDAYGLDVPAPDSATPLADVAEPVDEERLASRPIFAASVDAYAMIQKRRKTIWNWKLGYFELYDLRDDPEEKHNLASEHPEEVRRAACRMKEAFGF